MNTSWSDPTFSRNRGLGRRMLAVAGALAALVLVHGPLTAQEPGTITGEVTNELGAPLPGIQVTLAGTQRGTLTNASGAFVLFLTPLGVPAEQAIALGLVLYALNLGVSLIGAPAFAVGGRRQVTT